MTKSLILILISIWCMSCSAHKFILFEHIGAIDKPISCVIIANENSFGKQFCELQEEYVAKADNFKQLEKYILSNDTKLNSMSGANSFGSFKVQIDGKASYIVVGQQSAITYFTNLIANLNTWGNHKLADIIERSILIRLKGT